MHAIVNVKKNVKKKLTIGRDGSGTKPLRGWHLIGASPDVRHRGGSAGG